MAATARGTIPPSPRKLVGGAFRLGAVGPRPLGALLSAAAVRTLLGRVLRRPGGHRPWRSRLSPAEPEAPRTATQRARLSGCSIYVRSMRLRVPCLGRRWSDVLRNPIVGAKLRIMPTVAVPVQHR